MMTARVWTAAMALVMLAGCQQSEQLGDRDAVRTWANEASAVAAFLRVYDPVAQSFAQPGVYPDPTCPAVADDGTTLVITGECTATDGVRWFGSTRVERSGASDRAVTLDGYGRSGSLGDSRTTGTATVEELAADRHAFAVHVVVEGGIRSVVDYEGTVEGFFGDPVTVWNGHGTVARSGLAAPTGQVEATTVDQRLDSVCSGESASGTTTITADGHTVVVTYDGATDCDPDHSARWSFDGEDRGLVDGISCAARPGPAPDAGAAAGLLGLALALALAAGGRRARRSAPR